MSDAKKVFYTSGELADRWSMSKRTLEGWRDKGKGPNYHKIGGSVRYHIDDIERFERTWSSHYHEVR